MIDIMNSTNCESSNNDQKNDLENLPKLSREKHIKYFLRFLKILPGRLSSHDTTRLMIAYFSLSGLDILNALDKLDIDTTNKIIEWIYELQITSEQTDLPVGGFQGSTTVNTIENISGRYRCGHLAMTYTSLCSLLILGDNLSRVDRKAVLEGVGALQTDEGSFNATLYGTESDMRFTFCAAAICYILNDWSMIDRRKMAEYIIKSIGFDNGIAQGPNLEAHGGTTYCGLSALALSNQLELLSKETMDKLIRWLINRQADGFNGRPNKLTDTCYSFWVGGALKMLNVFHLTDFMANREFVMSTEDSVVGGFSKWPDNTTDPLHTYFGLCGLSLLNEPGLNTVEPSLNISMRAYEYLKEVQSTWGNKNL